MEGKRKLEKKGKTIKNGRKERIKGIGKVKRKGNMGKFKAGKGDSEMERKKEWGKRKEEGKGESRRGYRRKKTEKRSRKMNRKWKKR